MEDSGDVWGKKWEGVSKGMRGTVGQLREQEWVRSRGGCRQVEGCGSGEIGPCHILEGCGIGGRGQWIGGGWGFQHVLALVSCMCRVVTNNTTLYDFKKKKMWIGGGGGGRGQVGK